MRQTGEIVEVAAPLKGLFRGLSHSQKPFEYSESMNNVRAFDPIEGRARIGSRGGLSKAFQTQLGILRSGTAGTTNAAPGTTFDDAAVADWTTLGIDTSTDTLEIVSGTNVSPGTYFITVVATVSLTITPSPGASGSAIVYRIGNTPIRLASVIRTFNATGTKSYLDDFNGTALSGDWSEVGAPTLTFPTVSDGYAFAPTGSNSVRGGVLSGVTDISTNASREVSVLVDNADTSTGQKIYRLHLDTRVNSNMSNEGIEAYLEYGASGGLAGLQLKVNGSIVDSIGFSLVVPGSPTTFRLTIDEANTIRVYWLNETTPHLVYSAQNYVPVYALAAFRLFSGTGAGATSIAYSFALIYTSSSGGSPPEAAVFSANHLLYRESTAGALASVTSTVNLATDRRIYAASRLEKLYIADYGVRDSGTDGLVNGTSFDDAAGQNWTTLGISTVGDVLEVLSVGTGTAARLGVYAITTVAAGSLTLANSAGGDGTNAAVKYRVVRYPKVFDAAAITLTRLGVGTVATSPTSPASQFPAGCRSLVLWADRLVACNDPNTPHAWFMSAQGYPNLWDYGDTGTFNADGVASGTLIAALGASAAVPGTQSELAGLLGEPLVTTIPINDDLLVFACKTSFYALKGNPHPQGGGVMTNISREIGIAGIGAWCRTPDGRLLVMTPDGLYEIFVDRAVPISRDMLPQELVGLTDDLYEISLAYDVARRGIHIAAALLAPLGGVQSFSGIHYFYDLRTGGFLPENYNSGYEPMSVTSYQPGGIGMPTVLWGCRDGYVRRFDDAADSDDGTTFTSDVLYGPIRLGGSDYGEGFLHEIVCVLDVQSGSVTLSVHVGHSAQTAKNATSRYTTTMTAGRNRNRYPRLRGGVAYVKIAGTPGAKWAMESLTVTRENVGRLVVA